jgi:hypothetical protein
MSFARALQMIAGSVRQLRRAEEEDYPETNPLYKKRKEMAVAVAAQSELLMTFKDALAWLYESL